MKPIFLRLARAALAAAGLAMLAALCLGLVVLAEGWCLYRQALGSASVAQKLEEVQAIPGYTPLEQLPPFYIQAVLAVEDHRFYSHPGYDLFAIGRALWNDLLAGSFVEGGSTITQQLAKNLWLSQEKRLVRKVAELFLAVELEKVCTKREILEAYLNSIYFGSGHTGIGQAAEGYYGLAPDELDKAQCAMLAGIPNAPTAYALDEHPDLAVQRQRQVLRQMVRRHYLTQPQAEEILAEQTPLFLTAIWPERPFGPALAARRATAGCL